MNKSYYSPCSKCNNGECVFKGTSDTHELCEDFMGWIPVSERLPEESGRYLAYIINEYDNSLRYAMTADFYSKLKEWAVDDESASDNVVAWMDLPSPYKKEDAEEKKK